MLGKKLFPKRHDAEAPAIKCSAAARVSCDTLTDTRARRARSAVPHLPVARVAAGSLEPAAGRFGPCVTVVRDTEHCDASSTSLRHPLPCADMQRHSTGTGPSLHPTADQPPAPPGAGREETKVDARARPDMFSSPISRLPASVAVAPPMALRRPTPAWRAP